MRISLGGQHQHPYVGASLFQTIGAYVDALAFIAIGVAGRHFAPKWVSQDGSALEVQSRIARMRKASTVVLVGGIGFLLMRILGV
jgi:hypothetical protein